MRVQVDVVCRSKAKESDGWIVVQKKQGAVTSTPGPAGSGPGTAGHSVGRWAGFQVGRVMSCFPPLIVSYKTRYGNIAIWQFGSVWQYCMAVLNISLPVYELHCTRGQHSTIIIIIIVSIICFKTRQNLFNSLHKV